MGLHWVVFILESYISIIGFPEAGRFPGFLFDSTLIPDASWKLFRHWRLYYCQGSLSSIDYFFSWSVICGIFLIFPIRIPFLSITFVFLYRI